MDIKLLLFIFIPIVFFYATFLRSLHQAAFNIGRHDIETGKAS
jgi:hypothetical protein